MKNMRGEHEEHENMKSVVHKTSIWTAFTPFGEQAGERVGEKGL